MQAETDSTGAHVLVVDDEGRNRRLLDAMLVPDGYAVVEAADGFEALKALEQHKIDLVLLDVMMPGIDGIETCHRIRQQPRFAFLPIVFVTARGDRDARVRGKAVGGDDFLTKPVDEIELLVRVRNLVLIKQYREQLERQNERLEREVQRRTSELRQTVSRLEQAEWAVRRSHEITVHRLALAAEFRDNASARHIERMSRYCALICTKLGWPEDRVELMRLAATLHDVGKIGIPDKLLFKPGRLTKEEFDLVKKHPEFGYRILAKTDSALLELAAVIAYTHHERWDGGGYPQGLKAKGIPLAGRIATVADVFDALTSERVYKRAFSLDEAFGLLTEGRASHFDPDIADLFMASLDEIKTIMREYADLKVEKEPESAEEDLAGDTLT